MPSMDYDRLRKEVLRRMQLPRHDTAGRRLVLKDHTIRTRGAPPTLEHAFRVDTVFDVITWEIDDTYPAQWLKMADPWPPSVVPEIWDKNSYAVPLTDETYGIALQYIGILDHLRPRYVDRAASLCGTKACVHSATLKRMFRTHKKEAEIKYRKLRNLDPLPTSPDENLKVYKPLATPGGSDLSHRFAVEDASKYPELGLPIWWPNVITWPVSNAYPAWLLDELKWFMGAQKIRGVNVAPLDEFAYKMARKFIRSLNKAVRTIGTVSDRDADVAKGDKVITWANCTREDPDKAAYLEITKDFDVENALTWEEHDGIGRVCRFSKEGTFPLTTERILEAVRNSSISWRNRLLERQYIVGKKWTVQKEDVASVGVALLGFTGHAAIMYCPAPTIRGGKGTAEEWFYVDSWQQPPLKGQYADEFGQLARQMAALGKKIVHLPSKVMQEGEGSCAPVSLMKAFAVAHMIDAVNRPPPSLEALFKALTNPKLDVRLHETPAHYLKLCSRMGIGEADWPLNMPTQKELMTGGFKFIEAKLVLLAATGLHVDDAGRSAVHAVAQGIKENGEFDNHWLEKNACYAKLAHRLMRIHEVNKWEIYGPGE